jgi:hypothetical protein
VAAGAGEAVRRSARVAAAAAAAPHPQGWRAIRGGTWPGWRWRRRRPPRRLMLAPPTLAPVVLLGRQPPGGPRMWGLWCPGCGARPGWLGGAWAPSLEAQGAGAPPWGRPCPPFLWFFLSLACSLAWMGAPGPGAGLCAGVLVVARP